MTVATHQTAVRTRIPPSAARAATATDAPTLGRDAGAGREQRRPVADAGPSAAEIRPLPAAAAATIPCWPACCILTRLLERPTSAEALKAGLPLADGRLTPELAVRAAERAGLSARLVRQPLARISELTLPCVLLLEDRRACILVGMLPGERAQVVMPEIDDGAIELPLAELADRHTGYALLARPRLRFDRRADQVEGGRAAAGSGARSPGPGRSTPRSSWPRS